MAPRSHRVEALVAIGNELRDPRPSTGYAEAEGIGPDLPRLTKPFRNAERPRKHRCSPPGRLFLNIF